MRRSAWFLALCGGELRVVASAQVIFLARPVAYFPRVDVLPERG